jgi:hypothetical protein
VKTFLTESKQARDSRSRLKHQLPDPLMKSFFLFRDHCALGREINSLPETAKPHFPFNFCTGTELAVVTVDKIPSMTPKQFVTRLFNYWGVGDRNENNGVLVLFVTKQRRSVSCPVIFRPSCYQGRTQLRCRRAIYLSFSSNSFVLPRRLSFNIPSVTALNDQRYWSS